MTTRKTPNPTPRDDHGLEQARAARKQAEDELDEMIAQRPAVREVAKAAVLLRTQNHFSQLVTAAFRKATS